MAAKQISEPQQVSILEGGSVLVQYNNVTEADRLTLNGLAQAHVVVAPNTTLDHKIVLTAWLTKMSCDSVTLSALNEFVTKYATGQIAGTPTP